MTQKTAYDAVIVGGGHNGLTAAAYLARAGASVLVLERKDIVGGASISAQVFPGIDARLSRYSYLLSMYPYRIMQDLELALEPRRRPTQSFSSARENGKVKGLLIPYDDPAGTESAFREFTGSDDDYRGYRAFYDKAGIFASKAWDTMTQPLISRDAMKAMFTTPEEIAAWDMLIETPLGVGIENHVKDDTVRGIMYTDAAICVMSYPHDPHLLQNKTLLYHVIGNIVGEWRVPVGGMGKLTSELARKAREFGAEIITDAEVTEIAPAGDVTIAYQHGGARHTVSAKYCLVNAAPSEMAKLIPGHAPLWEDEGTAFKINMVLKRLPRLAVEGVDPKRAFAGTFHIDEGYANIQASSQSAAAGQIPNPMPGEIYCHTLTDPSILSPELAAQGYHTLTLYGVNAAHRLFVNDNEAARAEVLRNYVSGINRILAEPLEDCLAIDANGNPCIEAKSAVDLENELRLPKGHIFHNDQTWLFAEDPYQAGQWGVETSYTNVLMCGSGAARGGCVSGIPGHNAAKKAIEALGLNG